jgi:hypothetical protein
MTRHMRRAAARDDAKYDAELARRAVQEALDRRDNGGDAGH